MDYNVEGTMSGSAVKVASPVGGRLANPTEAPIANSNAGKLAIPTGGKLTSRDENMAGYLQPTSLERNSSVESGKSI